MPAAPCGDFRPDSDIDILVEFEPGARIGFFELVTMEPELTDLFGRQADLCTPEELSRSELADGSDRSVAASFIGL
ncbi:MAG: nucleotidyltransferase domain-containing protein, partial [Anaerolineae bacterium]|nr:nucleotidyltransferase domain-containing protein [Anaerolineae bacterium]